MIKCARWTQLVVSVSMLTDSWWLCGRLRWRCKCTIRKSATSLDWYEPEPESYAEQYGYLCFVLPKKLPKRGEIRYTKGRAVVEEYLDFRKVFDQVMDMSDADNTSIPPVSPWEMKICKGRDIVVQGTRECHSLHDFFCTMEALFQMEQNNAVFSAALSKKIEQLDPSCI